MRTRPTPVERLEFHNICRRVLSCSAGLYCSENVRLSDMFGVSYPFSICASSATLRPMPSTQTTVLDRQFFLFDSHRYELAR
jgi:hypothetical protein